MNNAINAVRSCGYGYLKDSLMYNVPKVPLKEELGKKQICERGHKSSWKQDGHISTGTREATVNVRA